MGRLYFRRVSVGKVPVLTTVGLWALGTKGVDPKRLLR